MEILSKAPCTKGASVIALLTSHAPNASDPSSGT
jgi:hypothetical protein